jgi:hypothetical protein
MDIMVVSAEILRNGSSREDDFTREKAIRPGSFHLCGR